MSRLLIALLAAVLVVASLSLITAQHRARGLFATLERSQQQAKILAAEGDRLRVELGRAAQPARVESSARQIGLKPVDAKSLVFLPAGSAAVPPAAGERSAR
jgi:cell division protein FtsL